MHTTRILFLVWILADLADAAEPVAPLQMPNIELRDVLAYYQRAAGTTAYVSPWVNRAQRVKIESPTDITKDQALQLIRTTLLADYEVLIRDTRTGETLVESVTPRKARERREKNSEVADAQENIQFPNTALQDVLLFYEIRSGQPVFAALDLGVDAVTISNKKPLSRGEVLPFIRDALGDVHGIELRTLFHGEVLVKGPPARRPAARPFVPRPQPRVRSISE